MPEFVHLHNHTEFSLLDGAAKIDDLTDKACKCGMSHVAITDHGNMFGVPKFVLAAKSKGLKPIVGCEFYIIAGDAREKDKSQKRYHQIMWAKNADGYRNLIKLCSYGYTDGYYYKPRIDKEILKQHADGVIASTCCLASEVNQTLLQQGEDAAEAMLKEYIEIFGKENYYVEIQRHTLSDMDKCNDFLVRMANKHDLKVIATNDVHYVNKEDSEAHDLLLALQTQSDYSDPNRFRFTDDRNQLNPRFYFKTQDEMLELFQDIPQALDHTVELAERCEFDMNLSGDMILPQYKVPPEYRDMDDFLAAMVWERAPRRYAEISSDISERIEHELKIIKKMGYAGYFLIVQSFTTVARERGVYVGPGRGSAAGSVIAYILGIIDVDPLKYDLLFERFLNPERVSPPDIDIDFDDEGRQEVINYVVEEYGRKSVSQVITYGTMGAKTALRDVGRTLGIELAEVNRIAKMIPDKPGITFAKALDSSKNPDFAGELGKLFESPDPNIRKMMQYAKTLEGTARHTGVHACAVIIAPDEITNYVPVSKAKDDAIVTQFDGPMAEKCGLLKMDFLGLKTLTIIKTAIRLVKENHGVEIDPDKIPFDDAKTFELYQRGDTVATFQFESDGMRKYLKQLKPTNLEDLIAMNALYRPGPMDNIPLFIDRKHGREPIEYPHQMLEPILKNTYGIMVYQEQIMQVAQKMANYSLGQADLLRRAMGKKKADVMAQEREIFIKGCAENDIDAKKAGEVFDIMEKFASYGFNKSHAAAYSILAFKTAYMKAHFPAEYMASVLTHNINDITKITFFIEECRRMGIKVLPPCVNESVRLFSVNEQGFIRFGLEAIKGVGRGPCEAIIEEREAEGNYKSLFDLTERIPQGNLNRKVLESLAYAGAFDAFEGISRAQYFAEVEHGTSILEKAISYGNKKQAEAASSQASLFGASSSVVVLAEPKFPAVEPWSLMEKLNFEKDVIGFYLSGHPLDTFKLEMMSFTTSSIKDLEHFRDREIRIGGIVTKARHGTTKNGSKFGIMTIEDFSGSQEIALFKDDYAKFRGYMEINAMLLVTGRYVASYRDPSVFEVKVADMQYLEGCSEKLGKRLNLQLELAQISSDLMDQLEELFTQSKGNCRVEFHLYDPAVKGHVSLACRNFAVNPDRNLIEKLEHLQVPYRLLA